MENKYFTPEISDIRMGYECEIKSNTGFKNIVCNEEWLKTYYTFSKDYILRVPYLTKEQIEKEGWEEKGSNMWKNGYWLIAGTVIDEKGIKSKPLHIADHNGDTYFLGECKDINTLRYICKLLNINKDEEKQRKTNKRGRL